MKDFFLALASIILSLLLVILLILLGWYIVWKLFLSKFVLVRELLGYQNEESTAEENRSPRSRVKRTRRD